MKKQVRGGPYGPPRNLFRGFSVPAIFLAFLLLLFGSEKPPAPFFQQFFFANFQVMRSTFGMKIHCLPDQGREKRWLERIVLCGFIQKFFKKYAAFFGRDLPQCAPQNLQVLWGALRAAAIRAFVCHRFLCACSEAHSSQRV